MMLLSVGYALDHRMSSLPRCFYGAGVCAHRHRPWRTLPQCALRPCEPSLSHTAASLSTARTLWCYQVVLEHFAARRFRGQASSRSARTVTLLQSIRHKRLLKQIHAAKQQQPQRDSDGGTHLSPRCWPRCWSARVELRLLWARIGENANSIWVRHHCNHQPRLAHHDGMPDRCDAHSWRLKTLSSNHHDSACR
jgi:hypothetical protein